MMYVVSVVCCQVGVCSKYVFFCVGLITRPERTKCGVSECDPKASIMRRPSPSGVCCAM